MKIKQSLREQIVKKLEYGYRNSERGIATIAKLNNNEDFTKDEIVSLSKKLEYRFKKSVGGIALLKELLDN